MYTSILTLNCHVKPEASALVTIVLDGISQQLIFPGLRLDDSDERGLGMHDGSLRGSLPRRVRGFYSGPA